MGRFIFAAGVVMTAMTAVWSVWPVYRQIAVAMLLAWGLVGVLRAWRNGLWLYAGALLLLMAAVTVYACFGVPGPGLAGRSSFPLAFSLYLGAQLLFWFERRRHPWFGQVADEEYTVRDMITWRGLDRRQARTGDAVAASGDGSMSLNADRDGSA